MFTSSVHHSSEVFKLDDRTSGAKRPPSRKGVHSKSDQGGSALYLGLNQVELKGFPAKIDLNSLPFSLEPNSEAVAKVMTRDGGDGFLGFWRER